MLQTIQKKAKGKKITAAPKVARAKDQGLDDIVSALQRSLTTRGKSKPVPAKPKKAARGAKARS
jgi:non-homologous end joining protein Ku